MEGAEAEPDRKYQGSRSRASWFKAGAPTPGLPVRVGLESRVGVYRWFDLELGLGQGLAGWLMLSGLGGTMPR